jgi:hypothetical protein
MILYHIDPAPHVGPTRSPAGRTGMPSGTTGGGPRRGSVPCQGKVNQPLIHRDPGRASLEEKLDHTNDPPTEQA